jgi:hypothetical protein
MIPGREVTGRVVDSEGHPLGGAAVYCGSGLTFRPDGSAIATVGAVTDDAGAFAIQGMPRVALACAALHSGAGRSRTARVPAGDEAGSVELVCHADARLAGNVFVDGMPSPNTMVTAVDAYSSGGLSVSRTWTSAEGAFAFEHLPAGPCFIEVMLALAKGPGVGHAYVRRVMLDPGDTLAEDIDLRTGTLSVDVLLAVQEGKPAGPAFMQLLRGQIAPGTWGDMAALMDQTQEMEQWYVKEPGQPATRFAGLLPGTYTLVVWRMPQAVEDGTGTSTETVQPLRVLPVVLPADAPGGTTVNVMLPP